MNNSISNMRVVPMDDYAYLTKTKVSHARCPICGKTDIDGAMVIYGYDIKQRIIMCNHCLSELSIKGFPTVINANTAYKHKRLVIDRLRKKQKCNCDLLHKKQDGFLLLFNGSRVFCCTPCFEELQKAVDNYNRAYNPIFLDFMEKHQQTLNTNQQKKIKKCKEECKRYKIQLKQELDLCKANLRAEQESFIVSMKEKLNHSELKLKEDAVLLVKNLRTEEAIELFFEFGETDRNRYINQLKVKKYGMNTATIQYPVKRSGSDFINSLYLVSAFPHTKCSLNHGAFSKPKAEYYIGCRNQNFNSFEFLLCKKCLNSLYECLYAILSDPALEKTEDHNVSIKRLKTNIKECYSCGKESETLQINWGNAIFYFCNDCAKSFFQKLGKLICKIDTFFHPLIIIEKEYPNYNNRVMKCKEHRKSQRLIGYSIDKAKKRPAEFIVDNDIYPVVECECIGHGAEKNSDVIIKTQREADNFCLALCKTCADNLSIALSNNNYEIPIGTPVFTMKKKWIDNEHCMFCGTNEGDCNKIDIGSISFCACNQCKKKLSDTLKFKIE